MDTTDTNASTAAVAADAPAPAPCLDNTCNKSVTPPPYVRQRAPDDNEVYLVEEQLKDAFATVATKFCVDGTHYSNCAAGFLVGVYAKVQAPGRRDGCLNFDAEVQIDEDCGRPYFEVTVCSGIGMPAGEPELQLAAFVDGQWVEHPAPGKWVNPTPAAGNIVATSKYYIHNDCFDAHGKSVDSEEWVHATNRVVDRALAKISHVGLCHCDNVEHQYYGQDLCDNPSIVKYDSEMAACYTKELNDLILQSNKGKRVTFVSIFPFDNILPLERYAEEREYTLNYMLRPHTVNVPGKKVQYVSVYSSNFRFGSGDFGEGKVTWATVVGALQDGIAWVNQQLSGVHGVPFAVGTTAPTALKRKFEEPVAAM